MAEIKRWRFFIPPQTHIRTTDSERWMFAESVSDEYLKKFGEKKYQERIAKGSKNPGTPMNYYNRKKTIQRYWDYKKRLRELADEQKFIMPHSECWIKYFLPLPKSWSKKKKLDRCFTLKETAPDCDNYTKAFLDGLMGEDKAISDYRASKFYYDGTGHIEVTLGELPPAKGYTYFKIEDKIK